MRSTTSLLALALAVSAGPAFAQASDTDTADVTINGRVTPLCVLGEPSQALVDLGQMVETSGGRVGRIAQIADQNVMLPDSFCNFAGSTATIDATALVETSAATAAVPAGFARAVNFTADVGTWGGGSAVTTTAAIATGANADASGTSAIQSTPRLTDLTVVLSDFTAPSDKLLVAGDYSGLVRVTLGPAAVTQ